MRVQLEPVPVVMIHLKHAFYTVLPWKCRLSFCFSLLRTIKIVSHGEDQSWRGQGGLLPDPHPGTAVGELRNRRHEPRCFRVLQVHTQVLLSGEAFIVIIVTDLWLFIEMSFKSSIKI